MYVTEKMARVRFEVTLPFANPSDLTGLVPDDQGDHY